MIIKKYRTTKGSAEELLAYYKKEFAAEEYMAKLQMKGNVPLLKEGKEITGYEVGVDYAPLD